MRRTLFQPKIILPVVAVALAIACGSQNGSSSGSGDAGDSSSSGSSNAPAFHCCLNQTHYLCPDMQALDRCAFGGFDVAACHAACAPSDFMCHMACDQQASVAHPDPSGCAQQN